MKIIGAVITALIIHMFAFWPQIFCSLYIGCSSAFQDIMLNIAAWPIAIHEFCHAFAGWMTGAQVEHIEVHKMDGVTYTIGGIYPIISMMGYLGSNMMAIALLKSLKNALYRVISMIFLIAFIVLMTVFSHWSLSLWIALVFAAIGVWFTWKSNNPVYNVFLASLLVLNSTNDVLTLLFYSTSQTDAGLLANYLGVPLLAWPIALSYSLAGGAILYFGITSLRRTHEKAID